MRLTLYNKTKCLYDFEIEKDSFHTAQAALLLTYHFASSDTLGNTAWLSTAVHHARRTSSQRQGFFPNQANDPSDLKRLWWCCVLRDRVLAVAHRQPLEIIPDRYDTTKEAFPAMDDVWDRDSEYYTAAVRIVLYPSTAQSVPACIDFDNSGDIDRPMLWLHEHRHLPSPNNPPLIPKHLPPRPLLSDNLENEIRPTSLGTTLPRPLTKESYLGFISSLGTLMSSFPFTVKEIIESEKDNKVVLWVISRAGWREGVKGDDGNEEEGVGEEGWNFEGEYVFILTMDESGERIRKFVEFMDSRATVKRAVRLLEKAGGNLAKKARGL
ncbi:hypothetical protein BDV12DRAFT_199908 [Aspergillus spectabilis]